MNGDDESDPLFSSAEFSEIVADARRRDLEIEEGNSTAVPWSEVKGQASRLFAGCPES